MSGIGFGSDKVKPGKKGKGKGLKKIDALSLKERRYLANRLQGKSKKDSAIDAGFSQSIAHNATVKIESRAHVRAALEEAVLKAVPVSKFLRRLEEGFDATTVKVATMDGQITDFIEVADYGERRQYMDMYRECAGLGNNNSKGPIVTVPIQIVTSIPRPQRG